MVYSLTNSHYCFCDTSMLMYLRSAVSQTFSPFDAATPLIPHFLCFQGIRVALYLSCICKHKGN